MIQDEHDGSAIMTIEDPNSKKRAVVPTYPRGCGPEQAVERREEQKKEKETDIRRNRVEGWRGSRGHKSG